MRLKQASVGVEQIVDNDPRYGLVPPGKYYATISSLETSTFRAPYGAVLNPEAADGKWTYLKVKPSIELHNEVATVIQSQDFVIGVINDAGELVSPKPNSGSLIWSNFGGAFFLLNSIGCIKDDTLDYNPEAVEGIVVKLRTFYRGYDSVNKINYNPDMLSKLLVKANDGMKVNFDDIKALLLKYNVSQGYSDVEHDNVVIDEPTLEECQLALERGTKYRYTMQDERLLLFNCVVGFWKADADDMDNVEGSFYDDDVKLLFTDVSAAEKYSNASSASGEDEDWS